MEKLIRPVRLAIVALLSAAILIVCMVTLYKLQIVEGRAYYEESQNNNISYPTVTAARGSIMDRYGRVLVENRVCNNLVIDETELFPDGKAETIAKANAAILQLAEMIVQYGDTYTDTLPITKTPPFEYTEMSDLQRVFLSAYLKDKKLPETTSAVELMAFMRDRYQIDNSYTAEQTRIIAGIRYEINVRYDINTTNTEEIMEAYNHLSEAKAKGVYQAFVMDEVYNKMEGGNAAMAVYYAGDYLSMLENNEDLAFVIPEEGSNWFVDSMCVLKDAQNKEEAEAWINFIAGTEPSLMNMDYIWYASPNMEALEQYPEYYEEQYEEELDPEIFEIMAAPDETLERCTLYMNLPKEILTLYNDLWTKLGI